MTMITLKQLCLVKKVLEPFVTQTNVLKGLLDLTTDSGEEQSLRQLGREDIKGIDTTGDF